MVDHLSIAPSAGPHYLPYTDEAELGVEGWRGINKWYCSPEQALTGFSTDGTHYRDNGLDYMLAYNLLWLECLQAGVASNYFELASYLNKRDVGYSILEGPEKTVFYHNSELYFDRGININRYQNSILIGHKITIDSYPDCELGDELTIIPDSTITLPEMEDLLDF